MSFIHLIGDSWYGRYDEEFCEKDFCRLIHGAGLWWQQNAEALLEPFGQKAILSVRDLGENIKGTVYIGFDTREHAQEYAHIAANILAQYHLRVIVSDKAISLAALSYAIASDSSALGGLSLTANDRPNDYLGVRFRFPDGRAATPYATEKIEALIPAHLEQELTPVGMPPKTYDLRTPYFDHLSTKLQRIYAQPEDFSAEQTVVVDGMYGVNKDILPLALEQKGFSVVGLHGQDDASFGDIHPACVEPWLDACEQEVVNADADFGLAIDGGGIRFAVIDEKGKLVPSAVVCALLLEFLVRDCGMQGDVVIPASSSKVIFTQAKRLSCKVVTQPEGYRWLREACNSHTTLYATDGLGSCALPCIGSERDGLLGALLFARYMATSNVPLSERVEALFNHIGEVYYTRKDVRVDSATYQILQNVLPGINPEYINGKAPQEVNHGDGLRLSFADGAWMALRLSRSKKQVHVYVEAPSMQQRDDLLNVAMDMAKGNYQF